MKFTKYALAPLFLGVLTSATQAQEPGSSIPAEIELEGYSQIPARSWDDLLGRAVLIEFFAYW